MENIKFFQANFRCCRIISECKISDKKQAFKICEALKADWLNENSNSGIKYELKNIIDCKFNNNSEPNVRTLEGPSVRFVPWKYKYNGFNLEANSSLTCCLEPNKSKLHSRISLEPNGEYYTEESLKKFFSIARLEAEKILDIFSKAYKKQLEQEKVPNNLDDFYIVLINIANSNKEIIIEGLKRLRKEEKLSVILNKERDKFQNLFKVPLKFSNFQDKLNKIRWIELLRNENNCIFAEHHVKDKNITEFLGIAAYNGDHTDPKEYSKDLVRIFSSNV